MRGFRAAAGLLMSGFAHLYVLFGTTNEQSFIGLTRMVHRLGAERLRNGGQADCVVVHAMIPESAEVAERSKETFRSRIEDIFRDHYLAMNDPSEELWSISDIGNNLEAPSVPVHIAYSQSLAFFSSIRDVATALTQGQFEALATRIQGRFPHVTTEE